MTGMITSQDGRKMTAEFLDLRIADIGIEDFFEYSQLLGPYELLIIQETSILYNGTTDHVLDLAEYSGSDIVCLHRKITSICIHWKCHYKNVSAQELRS